MHNQYPQGTLENTKMTWDQISILKDLFCKKLSRCYHGPDGEDEGKKVKVLITQPCLTLCNPVDCSPPGSSVHGILQARILEWVAIPFPRGSFWPRNQGQVSCTAGRFFTVWATREAPWAIWRRHIQLNAKTKVYSYWVLKNACLNLYQDAEHYHFYQDVRCYYHPRDFPKSERRLFLFVWFAKS